jgi:hypothetical protein
MGANVVAQDPIQSVHGCRGAVPNSSRITGSIDAVGVLSNIGPAAPLYRGRLPDRFLPRTDQKPEVGSHGGLVQGWVAKAPTRGALTHAESEVAADAFATARRAITWLSRAIAGVAIIAVVISAADKRVIVVIEFLHWFRANDAWLSNRDANWHRRTEGNFFSRSFNVA